MIGAIIGDIIGSPYEFERGNKSKEFPLFSHKSTYTDDTVMTLAVDLPFLDAQPSASDDWILRILTNRMRQFGKMYPNAGYGGMFRQCTVVRTLDFYYGFTTTHGINLPHFSPLRIFVTE